MKTKKNSLVVFASVLFILYSIICVCYLLFNVKSYNSIIRFTDVITIIGLPLAFLVFSIGLLNSKNSVCIIGGALSLLCYLILIFLGYAPFNMVTYLTLALVLLVIAVIAKNGLSILLAILAALSLIIQPL